MGYTISQIEDEMLALYENGKPIPAELSALIPAKLDEHINSLQEKIALLKDNVPQDKRELKRLARELDVYIGWKAKRTRSGFDTPQGRREYEEANGLPAEVFEIVEKDIYFCRRGL